MCLQAPAVWLNILWFCLSGYFLPNLWGTAMLQTWPGASSQSRGCISFSSITCPLEFRPNLKWSRIWFKAIYTEMGGTFLLLFDGSKGTSNMIRLIFVTLVDPSLISTKLNISKRNILSVVEKRICCDNTVCTEQSSVFCFDAWWYSCTIKHQSCYNDDTDLCGWWRTEFLVSLWAPSSRALSTVLSRW